MALSLLKASGHLSRQVTGSRPGRTLARAVLQAPVLEWPQAVVPSKQDQRIRDQLKMVYERSPSQLVADLQALAQATEDECDRWAAGVGGEGSDAQLLMRKAQLDAMSEQQARTRTAIACLKRLLDDAKRIVHEIDLAQFAEEVYLCGRHGDEHVVQEFIDFRESSMAQLQGMDQQLTHTMGTILALIASTEQLTALLPPGIRPPVHGGRSGVGVKPRVMQAS